MTGSDEAVEAVATGPGCRLNSISFDEAEIIRTFAMIAGALLSCLGLAVWGSGGRVSRSLSRVAPTTRNVCNCKTGPKAWLWPAENHRLHSFIFPRACDESGRLEKYVRTAGFETDVRYVNIPLN